VRAFAFGSSRPLGAGGAPADPDSVWSTLSVMTVENPMDHGAAGDGTTNDLTALQAAVSALPSSGGIVYLPAGKSFKKTNVWAMPKAHVKLWAPNGQAEIFASVSGNTADRQSTKSALAGFGCFGVKFRSDATARGNTLDDHVFVADDGASLVELVGCEINGSHAAGVFVFGASEIYECGNYVHQTYADHFHHTAGTNPTHHVWSWENWVYNTSPSDGDDGFACVTYGDNSTLCHDMEFWDDKILHTGWGRGFSVIGGQYIHIHDCLAIGVAGAGVIVATETDTSPCYNVTIERVKVTQCGHTIGHPGILITGDNPDCPTPGINHIHLTNCVSAANTGSDYAAVNDIADVTNTGFSTSTSDLPSPLPTTSDVVLKDTSILMTRDTTHVTSGSRPGLYRIHVREHGAGYQERFEYVVQGSPSNVTSWVSTRTGAGDYLSEQQTVSGTAYALLLCAAPVTLGSGVSEVTFEDLRAGDLNGSLSWLWTRINTGSYA
jgi:hypothetical protein